MPSEMRPRGVGDLLDTGMRLSIRHWRTLVLSVVCLVLPVQIVSALVTAAVAPEQFDVTSESAPVASEVQTELLVGQGVVLLLSILGALLATAVCFKAITDAYLGAQPDWRRSLRFALRRLGGLFVLFVALTTIIAVGLVCLIAPGIWLGVAFSVAVPVLLLERLGPFRALGRSFRLVRGRWWPTLATLLVGYVLVGLVGGLVQGVVMVVPSKFSDGNTLVGAVSFVIGGTAGAMLTTPYTAAVIALLYIDLRVRKEGLELERIVADAGVQRDPAAPVPALRTPRGGAERGPVGERYWAPPEEPSPSGWLPPRPSRGESTEA